MNLAYLPNIRGKYRFDAPLGEVSWFGTGGRAKVIFIPEDIDDLIHFLTHIPSDFGYKIIGAMSNTLVRDGGCSEIIIKLGRSFNYINHDNFSLNKGGILPCSDIPTIICANGQEKIADTIFHVGATVLDVDIAKYASSYGISGLEFLSGIPGAIGGAIAMNAGAYESDVSQVLHSVAAINRSTIEVQELTRDSLQLGYRYSPFAKDYIFLEARIYGASSDKTAIDDKMKIIASRRANTQPIKSRTGGSTFVNPNGNSAWNLIDIAGCRGMRIRSAFVSEQHCNFIISDRDSSEYPPKSNDIEELICAVQSRVMKNSGIELRREIVIIGGEDPLD